MKKKRLNRDGWGFHLFPYYQMRVDCEEFHGLVCLIRLLDGESQYWATPKAGRIQVAGAGVTWLQMIPDDTHRVITVKYFPDGTHDKERKHYPNPFNKEYQPSIWYVDITDGIEFDENGVAVYIDKYLDVIFTPEGDIKVDDRDELDAAFASGELSREQYDAALKEGDSILKELCEDIPATDKLCATVRDLVEKRIEAGEKPVFLYHGSQYDLDIIKPMQANGECNIESLNGIYAADSAKYAVPFALPIRRYPDDPSGKRAFTCDGGLTKLVYGSLNPEGVGYVYRLKSDSFNKIDEWQWVSETECPYIEKMTIKVKDFLHTVEFSKEALEINKELYGK